VIFEDLKEIDFIEISKILKRNITMLDIAVSTKCIAEKYGLPTEDATTAFFICFDCKSEFETINHEKARRFEQLKQHRLKGK